MADRGEEVLTPSTINPAFKRIVYELRGPLMTRAKEIEAELEKGEPKPFCEVIKHIGNPQALGQQPITFFRQVLALLLYPKMMESPQFPQDVKDRAKTILSSCTGGSMGSYPIRWKIPRTAVAEFISRRDGYPADPERIYMTNGGSGGIEIALLGCQTEEGGCGRPGVLIPSPGYPLFTAKLLENNAHIITYNLDEDNNWALNIADLQRALDEARPFCVPRALVLINPGNPTGQVLTYENIEDVIKICKKERLLLITDEVYQDNIYKEGTKFYSCKKILRDLGPEYKKVQLISLHSTSKGYYGECGLRGGYFELVGFSDELASYFQTKVTSIPYPSTTAQALMSLVCNPPQPGDESYENFMKEKNEVMNSLRKKAKATSETLNCLEGVYCNEITGAVYAFPRLMLPSKAIEEALRSGRHPDVFYVQELLENTGILVFPGSGFGQREGTFHFRITILPSDEKMAPMFQRLRKFHEYFMNKYR